MPISSKLPNVGTTVFSVMSALAKKHGAINLSQGFPDFDCSPDLIELAHKNMKNGNNQYADMAGLPILRDSIAHKCHFLYGISLNPDTDITITAGGTQALFTAIAAFVGKGDEVIVFEPCYDSYQPAVQLNGGTVVPIVLQAPDFAIPWAEVAQKITPRTRMLIVNTPHNPTGTIIRRNDWLQLADLLRTRPDIIVLSDEVYEHLVFDGEKHESIMAYPDLFERGIAVFSFGKLLHATGWKVGYAIAPKSLTAEFRKVHQYIVFSVNTPVQMAIEEYIRNADSYTELSAFFKFKRDFLLKNITNSRFTWIPSSGSYFQLLDYSAISDLPDTDLAIQLTQTKGIAAIPISVFYSKPIQQKMLRFCFAKREETLQKAAEILCSL